MKNNILFIVLAIVLVSASFVSGIMGIESPGPGEGVAATGYSETESGMQEGKMYSVREGNYLNSEGKEMALERVQNRIRLSSGEHYAECEEECNMTQEQVQNRTKLQVSLSNGRNAEIKIMPDVAAERALERLRLKNCVEEQGCTIELKEVGNEKNPELAYELSRERKAKILGFIGAKMKVQAQVNAETGEIIKTKKPWWSFLASEPQEI